MRLNILRLDQYLLEHYPPPTQPLMRAVFGHALGQNAIAEGWAPELLDSLASKRLWPNGYAVMKLKEMADASVRRLTIMDERLAGGFDLGRKDRAWRDRRLAQIAKCQGIADRALAGGDA